MTLPRRAWVRLNHLRTGVGHFHSCLYKSGMASSAACECGAEEQTVDYVALQCPSTCTAWRFWTIRQPNGCSTHGPRSSAAKQWMKETTRSNERGIIVFFPKLLMTSYRKLNATPILSDHRPVAAIIKAAKLPQILSCDVMIKHEKKVNWKNLSAYLNALFNVCLIMQWTNSSTHHLLLPLTISLVFSQNMTVICVYFYSDCIVLCKQNHSHVLKFF